MGDSNELLGRAAHDVSDNNGDHRFPVLVLPRVRDEAISTREKST